MFMFKHSILRVRYTGAWDQGGPGGPRPPLESRIYSVKILKIGKISFSLLVGPPLGKIRSLAPGNSTSTIFVLSTNTYMSRPNLVWFC